MMKKFEIMQELLTCDMETQVSKHFWKNGTDRRSMQGCHKPSICKQTNKTQHLQSAMKSGTPVPSSLTVILGNSFHLSGPQFLHLQNQENKDSTCRIFGRIKGDNM